MVRILILLFSRFFCVDANSSDINSEIINADSHVYKTLLNKVEKSKLRDIETALQIAYLNKLIRLRSIKINTVIMTCMCGLLTERYPLRSITLN